MIIQSMPIEAVSSPSPLSGWHPTSEGERFYLELYGETRPLLDTSFAEVLPAGPASGDTQRAAASPIYEYWWTIGHPGLPRHVERGSLSELFRPHAEGFWDRLADDAAHVFLFFPLGGGWRIKELAATLKYLSPVREERSLLKSAAEDWQAIEPFLSAAAGIASAASPIAAAAARDTGAILSALAKLKLTSVPPDGVFKWSAAKVTVNAADYGVLQGVMWRVPRNVFEELGGRVTGSLAVSFIPASEQTDGVSAEEAREPRPLPLLAHAGVFAADGTSEWRPAQNAFLELYLSPQLPTPH